MGSEWKPETVNICIEQRPDGGLRAWSPTVPGLILSHSDENKVMADILIALRGLGHFAPPPPGELT